MRDGTWPLTFHPLRRASAYSHDAHTGILVTLAIHLGIRPLIERQFSVRNGAHRRQWYQYRVWRLGSETVLSKSGDHICFISSSVRQCVIISLSTLVGENGMYVGLGCITTILFTVRVTVVDELSRRILYLKVPSAIAYFLSIMAMVGILSI